MSHLAALTRREREIMNAVFALGNRASADAIRSCSLIVRAIADGIAAGKAQVSAAEFAPPVEETGPAAEAEAETDDRPAAEEVSPAPEYEPVAQAETVEEPEPEAVAVTEAVQGEAE